MRIRFLQGVLLAACMAILVSCGDGKSNTGGEAQVQCAIDQILLNGICTACPAFNIVRQNMCVECSQTQIVNNNMCVNINCPANQVIMNRMCVDCPAGQEAVNGQCQDIVVVPPTMDPDDPDDPAPPTPPAPMCPSNSMLMGAMCQCNDNTRALNGLCQGPPASHSDGRNMQDCSDCHGDAGGMVPTI